MLGDVPVLGGGGGAAAVAALNITLVPSDFPDFLGVLAPAGAATALSGMADAELELD